MSEDKTQLNSEFGRRLKADRELLYQFQQVQKLPAEDKITVKKLLDAFIFQRTVQGLASGQSAL